MSDHISGPRALADPIADITDVYAFPSPEQSGRLVLVLNTLPMAKPSDVFSDGLLYRFRLRPLHRPTSDDAGWRFVPGDGEIVVDCVFDAPTRAAPKTRRPLSSRAPASVRRESRSRSASTIRQGGSGRGLRVFAGTRWDPFIMDARAALTTLATHELAFTDPGSIFLDGKNVLSIVVEIDTGFVADWGLVGVVAETLTRGTFNVRIERVGRPEVKNMMLAPKEFDPVNRDLEIRDLYNMEDAFHLGDSYVGAYRARLDANLAFWDGLDGKLDWVADANGRHPLTDLVLDDYLIVDVTKPYRGARLVPRDRARRTERNGSPDVWGSGAERRRDGHDLHPAGQRRPRPHRARRRRLRFAAGHW